MSENPGHCPSEAIGKRVNVVLANGRKVSGVPADGSHGVNWAKRGDNFDIREWELAS